MRAFSILVIVVAGLASLGSSGPASPDSADLLDVLSLSARAEPNGAASVEVHLTLRNTGRSTLSFMRGPWGFSGINPKSLIVYRDGAQLFPNPVVLCAAGRPELPILVKPGGQLEGSFTLSNVGPGKYDVVGLVTAEVMIEPEPGSERPRQHGDHSLVVMSFGHVRITLPEAMGGRG